MEKSPLISVVMSVYNDQAHIKESLDSIFAQTIQDFEIIIIDDKSDDDTVQIIRQYKDERVRLYLNGENRGLTINLNHALKMVRGQFIARMDGDDVCRPERFEKELSYLLSDPELMLVSCRIHSFGEENLVSDISGSGEKLKAMMLVRPVLAHPGFFMRRELVEQKDFFYDESYRSAQDYNFAVRVAEKYKIGVTPEILLDYRVHKKQVSNKSGGEQRTNARRVREMQVERLGIQLTEKQKQVYEIWAMEKRECPLEYYHQVSELIGLIIAANTKKKCYDPNVLERELKKLLFQWMLRSKSPSVWWKAVTVCGFSRKNLRLLVEKAWEITARKLKCKP